MTWAAIRRNAWPVALLSCAVLVNPATVQASPPGVFSEVQTAVGPGVSRVLEPATVRSRMVEVDTRKITAARRGRELLQLNLFDDAVVEVRIGRVRATQTGYFLSGRPEGMREGEVRLVVNGPVMVGTVVTPKAKFTIRSAGSGRHVVRQIDPSAEPFECAVEDPPLLPPSSLPAISAVDQSLAQAPPPPPAAEAAPTEDGSEVRILVVYTPAMQARQGGPAGMRALVDMMVQSANQAFEDGGIAPRLVLAHAAMVDYTEGTTGTDLSRLQSRNDGYMDQVHELRNRFSADLVHLLTVHTLGAVGSAYRLIHERVSEENTAGFAVTATGSEETFTHEVGHNFGLRHDRHVDSPEAAIYPYAFGYINQAAFEADAPASSRWRTVMAYNTGCGDAGFFCQRLLRFSNPDQEHLGDALGVSAQETSTGADGPADARLTINNSARWVGSFRSQACTGFTVSPSTQITSRKSGELSFRVQADPGCLWQSSSQADFVTISSGTPSAGSGFLHVEVQANEGASERTGTLTVAGETITVRQLATEEGVCGRTTAVMKALTSAAGYGDVSQCDQVTDGQLAGITTLSLDSQGLTSLKAGDLQGLSGLEQLYLESNQLSELPEGLFSDLSSLTTLYLSYNRLAKLPAGLFTGLSRLERLSLNDNTLMQLPAGLFAGLSSLTDLSLSQNDLQGLPDGIFADLANLEKLNLDLNDLVELPPGVLTGLASLRELGFAHNQLIALAGGTFSGLANLEHLSLFSNELTELPADLFDGLTTLKELDLGRGKFSTIPAGLFDDLSSLESLNFWDGRLLELPAGRFSGLSNLRVLNLNSNRLTELPAGAFAGLSGLEQLLLGRNEFAEVPADLVSGLNALKELVLDRNHLSRLPDGIFSGLTTLEKLHLGGNLVDPLPLTVTLNRVGVSQIKAVVPTGAPFALDLPLSLGSAGETDDGAASLSIAAGAVESSAVTVTRVAGTEGPVDADIVSLPSLPANHSGYVFSAHDSLPVRLMGSQLDTDATLAGFTLSATPLEPAFSADTASYTAVVAHTAATVTITYAKGNPDATVAFLDASDQVLADADTISDGQQVSLDVGENRVKVRVTAADTTTTRTYELTITRDGATNVCRRTPLVREAILEANSETARVADCFDVTAAQLAGIRRLPHFAGKLTAVKAGDFAGLTALESLSLDINELRSLPEGVFDGLVALKKLGLAHNEISSLPAKIFSGLSALEELALFDNRLSTLPSGMFSGLSSIKTLGLSENQLTRLPSDLFADLVALERLSLGNNQLDLSSAGLFSNLTALKRLDLFRNRLRSLPSGIFSDLTNLEYLSLQNNRFSSLPAGLFSGLIGLETLNLETNTLNPLPLALSLEKVGANQLKAVAPTGAPFALDVPVSVSSAGEIQRGAGMLTIQAGATESAPVRVNRIAGTSDSVTVDIETLTTLPSGHTGYAFDPDDSLPVEVLPSTAPEKDAALRRLSISPGTLDPSFGSGTVTYSVSVANGVSSVTLNVLTSNANASFQILDADDQALTDADVMTEGFQADLSVGENVIKVQVTSEDATTSRTYTITASRNSSPEITTQPSISMAENETAVATLSATDADGDEVNWWTNGGADAGRFDLTLDGVLTFASAPDYENPADLDADNEYEVVAQASDGIDDAYLTLTVTITDVNPEEPPPEIIAGICDRSEPVRDAIVAKISGIDACANVADSHLSRITSLDLSAAGISSLESGDFAGLTALESLFLFNNQLSALPADIFSGLTALESLNVGSNQLSSLPNGLFAGLNSLATVNVRGNTVDPLPIAVSLEKVGESGFRAIAPIGAPFALVLPVSVSSAGLIGDGATTITIPAGAVESVTLEVTRVAGTVESVTVEVGALPSLPQNHEGYALAKSVGLPLEFPLPRVASPPARVTGVEVTSGVEQLEVSWTAVSDADGYKVQWKSGCRGIQRRPPGRIAGKRDDQLHHH